MKAKKTVFKELAYGKVLFDEKFWYFLKCLLLADVRSEEGLRMELLPYVEELKRIFLEGSPREQGGLIRQVVTVFQDKDHEKKMAWINFCQEFVEMGLGVKVPKSQIQKTQRG